MKTSLLTLTFGLILCAFSIGGSSDSRAEAKKVTVQNFNNFIAAAPKEIILQVPQLNEKNLDILRKNIESFGGMTFKGSCMKLQVVMYLIDGSVHSDYAFLNTAFANSSMTFLVKEGATIQQVQNECGISSVITPANSGE